MGVVSRLCPVNVFSIFYGLTFLAALLIAVTSVFSLAAINRMMFYEAEKNDCWQENSSALFGEDNLLYCPDTNIINKVSLADPSFMLSAYVTDTVPLMANRTLDTFETTLNLNENVTAKWYFYANKGSYLSVSLSNMNHSLRYEVNSVYTNITGPTSQFIVPFDETNSWKLKFRSFDYNNGVKLNITLFETYYGDFLQIPKNANQSCRLGLGCNFDLDLGSKQCINMWADTPRYWGQGWRGRCILVTTQGYDYLYAGTILPVAFILIVILLALIVVVNIAQRRMNEKEKQEKQLMRNVDSDSNLKQSLFDDEVQI